MLALQIEAEENAQLTETALLQERETAELREQFIAVLGHDLRNPLFAISAGAEMLLRKHPDLAIEVRVRNILGSAQRATRLVDDVLDFARGRLGKGIPVNIQPCADLTEAVQQVVTEIRNVHPQRTIHASIGDLQGLPVTARGSLNCCRTCWPMRWPMATRRVTLRSLRKSSTTC